MINEDEIKKTIKNINLCWIFNLSSLFVLILIAYRLKTSNDIKSEETYSTLKIIRIVFYCLTVLILILSKFLKKVFINSIKNKSIKIGTTQNMILQKYVNAIIVILGLIQGIGMAGFILYIISSNKNDLYIFIIISTVALLLNHPRKEEVLNLIQNNTIS